MKPQLQRDSCKFMCEYVLIEIELWKYVLIDKFICGKVKCLLLCISLNKTLIILAGTCNLHTYLHIVSCNKNS